MLVYSKFRCLSFRILCIVLSCLLLLNDLSFATSDTFQNLSPKSKIGEPDVPFLRDLAFVMVSAVIGKYLSLAIYEPTAKRDAARIVEEISHKIPPGMLTLAREQGVILRGFALNELAYNDSRDRILLPVYREDLNGNTVRAFTYIYSLYPKDHDIWMPIGKGGKVYIRCESAPGYGAPASKATGHPPSASSVIDIGTRKISVRSCHATAEIDDMSRAIIYGRYSRLRLGIIDDLRHAASELARNIRNSLPGYDLSSWIITYPPSIAPLNSAASLAALISDELGIPVVKMRKSHKAAKKYYLESKSGEKEALIKG